MFFFLPHPCQYIPPTNLITSHDLLRLPPHLATAEIPKVAGHEHGDVAANGAGGDCGNRRITLWASRMAIESLGHG